jgi:signal transduction histidine kinase
MQENIHKFLLEAVPDIIIQVDLYFNVLYAHIPNLPEDRNLALIGKNIVELTSPEPMKVLLEKNLNIVLQNKIKIRYASEGFILDKYRYYDNYISPLFDNQNNLHSIYFLSKDVTIEKEFEKQKSDLNKKLNSLFEYSTQSHIIFDERGCILWYNKRANFIVENIFNRKLELDKNYNELFEFSFTKLIDNNILELKNGNTLRFEYIIPNSKDYKYADVILQPIFNNEDIYNGFALVASDITQQKKYEEELEFKNNSFQFKNDLLAQYSYTISHNIRGPIATIKGLNQLIQISNNEEEKSLYIEKLNTMINQLDQVVVDLNWLLNMQEHQPLIKEEVNLFEELINIKEMLSIQIQEKNFQLNFMLEENFKINTVKALLNSILYNLISNAIKYCNSKVNSFLEVSIKNIDDNTIIMKFHDNGIGIDLSMYKNQIFGMFKQFSSIRDGKGLGLYLTKSQVEMLGGSITIDSIVNVGTTFEIKMPIK